MIPSGNIFPKFMHFWAKSSRAGIIWPALLILFGALTPELAAKLGLSALSLSGYWSLGKLVAVAAAGSWLSLSGVRRLGVPFLAHLAALAWATVYSSDPWTSLWGLHGTYNTGLLCALVLVPFWACPRQDDRPAMERGLLFGVAVFCALGLLQKLVWNPWPWLFEGRAFSTMGSPIYAGAICVFALPYFYRDKIISLGIVGMLWATGSRGAWIAAGAGALYQTWPAISRRVRYWGIVAALAGLCGAFYIRPLSDLGRAVTWRAALDAFYAKPWTGWGPGAFYLIAEVFRNPLWQEVYGVTSQDHAHNLFLEAASTSGVFGLVTLSAMLWAMWCRADRTTRAALLGVFIVGMLNPLPMVVKALCLAFCASCHKTNT